jgi:hypothetical protein
MNGYRYSSAILDLCISWRRVSGIAQLVQLREKSWTVEVRVLEWSGMFFSIPQRSDVPWKQQAVY